MKLDDIRQMITGSSAADWQQISGTHLFIYALGEVISPDEHWVSVDYHHSLAVFKEDVNLRLAYGLEQDRDLQFDEARFPYQRVSRSLADAFWQGALVARWTYLVVDGGRCYLPEVEAIHDGQDEHPDEYDKWEFRGWAARESDVAMARLLNDLTGRAEDDVFERYLSQAGITEIPG
jgi:hypothetical protein